MGNGTNIVAEVREKTDRILGELESQTRVLGDLVDQSTVVADVDHYSKLRDNAVANAGGVALVTLPNTLGYGLELISFSTVAAAGVVNLFSDAAEPQNLLWSKAIGVNFSDSFPRGFVIAVNGVLVVQFTGVVAGTQCFANVNAKRVPVANIGTPYAAHGGMDG